MPDALAVIAQAPPGEIITGIWLAARCPARWTRPRLASTLNAAQAVGLLEPLRPGIWERTDAEAVPALAPGP